MEIKITVKSYTKEVMEAIDKAVERGMETCGLLAEGYAKKLAAVDTGLMRNSVTHATSGKPFSYSYTASYGENTYVDKNGKTRRRSAKSKNAGAVGSGTVSGVMGTKDEKAMYIGTNVYYAPYVEMGTSRARKQPFIKPALENHVPVYKKALEQALKSLG